MRDRRPIVMYGSAGHARTLAEMFRHSFTPDVERDVVAFIDDFAFGGDASVDDVPIVSFERWRRDHVETPCVMGMGSPSVRARLVAKVLDAGGTFENAYADRPRGLFAGATIGPGCFIGTNSFIGVDTVLGHHVQILPFCCVGHDVVVGDFCTLCPSSTVSGHVVIEEGVFVGAGTTIVNGTPKAPLRIGRGAKIWAGSVVTHSVPAGASVGGNPAVPLRQLAQRRRALVAV